MEPIKENLRVQCNPSPNTSQWCPLCACEVFMICYHSTLLISERHMFIYISSDIRLKGFDLYIVFKIIRCIIFNCLNFKIWRSSKVLDTCRASVTKVFVYNRSQIWTQGSLMSDRMPTFRYRDTINVSRLSNVDDFSVCAYVHVCLCVTSLIISLVCYQH